MLDFQKSKIGKLLDEKGSAMVEYAILLAFVAVIAAAFIGGNNSISASIKTIIKNIGTLLGTAASNTPTSGADPS